MYLFPHLLQRLCQRLIQLSKHFWNSIVGIAIRAVFDFSITSFKRVPRNGFLTRSNRKKSHEAISSEFDGCRMVFVSSLVKNSRIMMVLCDGALSWCKIHSIFKTVKNRKYVQRQMYSRQRNFYKCQAMVIKFSGNVNDRCGNLIKKTKLKSADSKHHLVIIPGTF